MSPPPARRGADGVLLALTGEDAAIVRALDAAGSGLSVVRRCGDVAELLSAALAGLRLIVIIRWKQRASYYITPIKRMFCRLSCFRNLPNPLEHANKIIATDPR